MFYPDFIGSNENYNELRIVLRRYKAQKYCPWCKSRNLYTSSYTFNNCVMLCEPGIGDLKKCLNCQKIYTYTYYGGDYNYLDIHEKTGLPFTFDIKVGDILIEYDGTIDTITKIN